jgi:hypothetical protein
MNKQFYLKGISMFGLFKKKTEKEKLQEKYKKLLKESYDIAKVNRTQSDAKAAEANEVLKQIEGLGK